MKTGTAYLMHDSTKTISRHVVLHYHLFKNAGTSVDRVLKANFSDRWVTREFSMAGGNNTEQVEDWIRETPDAVAYSTHTAVGPLPNVAGVEVIPLVMLRDPIARICSAYRFERHQDADTLGANLAKEHDFAGYVRARLERKNDRQCRDFHVSRLATMRPGPEDEMDRAIEALDLLMQEGVVGLVDDFAGTIERLQWRLRPSFPYFKADSVRANTSSSDIPTGDPEVLAELEAANANDFDLLELARVRLHDLRLQKKEA